MFLFRGADCVLRNFPVLSKLVSHFRGLLEKVDNPSRSMIDLFNNGIENISRDFIFQLM